MGLAYELRRVGVDRFEPVFVRAGDSVVLPGSPDRGSASPSDLTVVLVAFEVEIAFGVAGRAIALLVVENGFIDSKPDAVAGDLVEEAGGLVVQLDLIPVYLVLEREDVAKLAVVGLGELRTSAPLPRPRGGWGGSWS